MFVLYKTVLVLDSATGNQCGRRAGVSLTALANVANRPIIHHVLDGIIGDSRDAGVIVAGTADVLIDVRACLRDYGNELSRVDYAICPTGFDLGSILSVVAPLVGDTACLVAPADGLLEQPIPQFTEMLEQESPDFVLLVPPEVFQTGVNGTRTASSALPVKRTLDIGFFGPRALARASQHLGSQPSPDLTAAGRYLAECGAKVLLHPVGGWHRYGGDDRDLLELNRVALERLPAGVRSADHHGVRLEGRVMIDRTASVRNSAVIGPSVIGPGATISNAYIGPYTSIGARAHIEGAEIERSIVSAGASVTHTGGRLVSSLVGPDARVLRDFSLPRALRLCLRDGDEVALC